ncbi:MAG: hypothetical protein KAJ40_02695 [Alphaproteobacteria bacterium]|nr:hypothetical protein [Alphaproteobacteria bacterium]
MASFDFIEASAKGYEFSWRERSYLLRAAIPLILVKFFCTLAIYFFNIPNQSLLSGFVHIPAYVVEALYMISVIRFIVFREPLFNFRAMAQFVINMKSETKDKSSSSAQHKVVSNEKTQMFKAGVVFYLLIKTIQTAMTGALLEYSQTIDPQASSQVTPPNMLSVLFALIVVAGMLWAFRLIWLYIPVTLGYSIKGFLAHAKGMMSSFSMFATWFMCYLPLVVLFTGVFMVVDMVIPSDTILQVIIHDVIRISGEIMIAVVQITAMTFGFVELLTGRRMK